MNTIEEIFEEIRWPTRLVALDKLSLLDIQREIGFELPDDYKDFLCRYTEYETFLGQQFLRLWDKEKLIIINREFEILTYLPNSLGIGSNGAGELIAIEKLDDGRLRVVLTPFIFDKQDHIEIGESFTKFILNTANGNEWLEKLQ